MKETMLIRLKNYIQFSSSIQYGLLQIFQISCNQLNKLNQIQYVYDFQHKLASNIQNKGMYQRKIWTAKEDQTLKQLKQVRKIDKWSQIANIMKEEFQIFGRNGKQCRQRYTNHLDSRINKQKWGIQEQEKLLDLHNKWGNKWAAISRELPGRTDNCIKNRFYSCFRKGIKTSNSLINGLCKKKIRPFSIGIIAKIVSIIQTHHKQNKDEHDPTYNAAMEIKNQILELRNVSQQAVSKANITIKLQQLSKHIVQLNKICRKKIVKKKSSKICQEDESSEYKNRLNVYKDSQQQNQNIKQFLPQKEQYIETQERIKIQAIEPYENQEKNNNELLVQNKTLLAIEQTPIKNNEKDEKWKNSSYYSIKSIDYLDAKVFHNSQIKQFIYLDDEKQWKLYFE